MQMVYATLCCKGKVGIAVYWPVGTYPPTRIPSLPASLPASLIFGASSYCSLNCLIINDNFDSIGQPLYPLDSPNKFPVDEWISYHIFKEDFWRHQHSRQRVFLPEKDFLREFKLFYAQHIAIKQVQKPRTKVKASSTDTQQPESSSSSTKTIHQCTFESCKRVFKRQEQARACEDKHRGILRYMCKGSCGVTDWCVRKYMDGSIRI
jgi:hypothetical protein